MNENGNVDDSLNLLELARGRNRLANERTMLAYMRTAIMLFATGGTLIKLFAPALAAVIGGWLIIAIGVFVVVIGLWRFLRIRTKLA